MPVAFPQAWLSQHRHVSIANGSSCSLPTKSLCVGQSSSQYITGSNYLLMSEGTQRGSDSRNSLLKSLCRTLDVMPDCKVQTRALQPVEEAA